MRTRIILPPKIGHHSQWDHRELSFPETGLDPEGTYFLSETDTEVFIHLLKISKKRKMPCMKPCALLGQSSGRLRYRCHRWKILICVAARKGSPLWWGWAGRIFMASDATPIIGIPTRWCISTTEIAIVVMGTDVKNTANLPPPLVRVT
jgi:glucosamine 6-phosphate synthetase-like amidotransferase/phosphosugar isomerase protein